MDGEEQIARVAEKLVRARKGRSSAFGSEAHRFRLLPPVPRDVVAAFEARHRVSLPSDYRSFITGISSGGAGPAYGLVPFEQSTTLERDLPEEIVAAPFPFTTSHNPYDDPALADYWAREARGELARGEYKARKAAEVCGTLAAVSGDDIGRQEPGDAPVYPSGRPASIRIYFWILVTALALRWYRMLAHQPYGRTLPTNEGPVFFLLFATVVIFTLYALMLDRRNWARIALGVVTFPLGLILLLARSARAYSGAIVEVGAEGEVLGLRGSSDGERPHVADGRRNGHE